MYELRAGISTIILMSFVPLPALAVVKPHKLKLRQIYKKKVPEEVEATIKPEDYNRGTGTTSSTQLLAKTIGCGTDVAGHAVPQVLGGAGNVGNIYPFDKDENGKLAPWEKELGQKLKNGECTSIEYKVSLTYNDDKLKLRPTRIKIIAECTKPDGSVERDTKDLDNPKDSKCATKTYPEPETP